jgi:branched-subunit amino acid ABC-type transport system permease component
MEFFIISTLNGISYGLLLFMLSSGLTLIFSMMGVLNFAHASFYMLGAYIGYSVSQVLGFWPALLVAPLIVGVLGSVFERYCLRRVHKFGHVPELLITFGLTYVVLELVQLVWGRIAIEFKPPTALQGPAFTLINDTVSGLRMVWGAANAEMCSASTLFGSARVASVKQLIDDSANTSDCAFLRSVAHATVSTPIGCTAKITAIHSARRTPMRARIPQSSNADAACIRRLVA